MSFESYSGKLCAGKVRFAESCSCFGATVAGGLRHETSMMIEMKSPVTESFSIMQRGTFRRLLPRLISGGGNLQQSIRIVLFAVIASWFPLLVLSLMQGEAYGTRITIPFLRDLAVNVRLLIAVPILILAESEIDRKLRVIALHFLKSGLVPEKELPSFEDVIEKTTRLRDRVLPRVLLIVAAFSPAIFLRKELLMGGISNWHYAPDGSGAVSLAGWWFSLVGAPIFLFLLLRWLWRMFVWTAFVWRASRIHLYLIATHADLAGGLGFLSGGQMAFSPIVFAGGTVIAAQVGNAIAYRGATLSSEKFPMIAYVVIAIFILIAPLFVVSPTLMKIRKKALLEYGSLVTSHNQQFDLKWIHKQHPVGQTLLGNPDASSLIDLASSFSIVRAMIAVPIGRRTLIELALAAVLPMIPVILFATPADQLIHAVLKMLG
jgi:hypothetical protein